MALSPNRRLTQNRRYFFFWMHKKSKKTLLFLCTLLITFFLIYIVKSEYSIDFVQVGKDLRNYSSRQNMFFDLSLLPGVEDDLI